MSSSCFQYVDAVIRESEFLFHILDVFGNGVQKNIHLIDPISAWESLLKFPQIIFGGKNGKCLCLKLLKLCFGNTIFHHYLREIVYILPEFSANISEILLASF